MNLNKKMLKKTFPYLNIKALIELLLMEINYGE